MEKAVRDSVGYQYAGRGVFFQWCGTSSSLSEALLSKWQPIASATQGCLAAHSVCIDLLTAMLVPLQGQGSVIVMTKSFGMQW